MSKQHNKVNVLISTQLLGRIRQELEREMNKLVLRIEKHKEAGRILNEQRVELGTQISDLDAEYQRASMIEQHRKEAFTGYNNNPATVV